MRFLVLSDIHGDTGYIEMLDDEFAAADAVLFAGDFARDKEPETGMQILNTLVKKHDDIFAVIGNCDDPSFIEELEKLDVSVQGDMLFRDGLAFAGSGGALRFTGTTANERSDDELVSDLSIVAEQESVEGMPDSDWNNLILILHQPPFDTGTDKITAGISTGSKTLRAFIEKHQPLLVVTGHIHESFATAKLGKTVLINPGSLAEGRYGIVEVEQDDAGVWTVSKCELKELKGN
ncbi:MAG: metallophosphoesterase family protein [Treponema sp.]|nr:metallophosphoesterase family protein [Candidatus Treponema caballi]